MAAHTEEVDWDRLDKKKMLIQGAGMFSGVTVALYPLSVIKTKQMTLPGISGGFQGVKQTASTIMRTEGIPGYYRGFGTVICGTIPARMIYLTTLEWTKSQVGKAVSELGLSGPTNAGVANFFGGALASLATQSVTVPIDVISQKQIVHGDETVVARHQHHRGPPQAASSSSSSNSSPSSTGSGTSSSSASVGTGASGAGAGGSSAAEAASSSGSRPPATSSSAPGSSSNPGQGRVAAPTSEPTSAPASSPAASRSSTGASASTSSTPASSGTSSLRRIGSLQMIRLIIKEEGMTGLYRGFGASVATFVPSSAVWWGAYGAYQKLIWAVRTGSGSSSAGSVVASSPFEAPQLGAPDHPAGEVVAVQVTSSVLAGCTSSLVTTPLDLIKTRIQVSYKHDGATPTFREVARQILREDGAAGFLRGAVPRMLNTSLWGTCMVTVYEYLKRVCAKEE